MSNQAFSARANLVVGFLALFVLVGGFGTWAVLTEISGAIISSGRIEVDQNRQVVQHQDGGIVADILVEEGDIVGAGDTLIRLDDTLLRSDLTILEGQLYELMARRGRLEAERDDADEISFDAELIEIASKQSDILELVQGQERLFFAKKTSLEKEIEQLQKRREQISDQIRGVLAQITAMERQVDLTAQELESQQSLLDRGLAQSARVLGLQREQARLAGQIGELQASIAQSQGRITEIEIEIIRQATVRREQAITELRDIQFRELEIVEQRLALRERLTRLSIKAPVSGVIYGMTVFAERSVIRPADPVLFLVPQDRPLVVAAQVEPIHIEQAYVGQEVTLRFSAFDQNTTPEIFGHVNQLSADVFVDEATQIPYYRAEILVNEGELDKLPENLFLIPGMPVEAFLKTDDRTPMAYLIKPFRDYLAKAFRES